MKICFFNSGFLPSKGGVATLSYEWAMQTSRNSQVQEVRVIAFGNPAPRRENQDKLQITAYRSRNPLFIGFVILSVFLRYRNFDLFHATNLFPVGFWTVLFGKIFRKKTAVSFYGTDACSNKASGKAKSLKRWTIDHADFPLTISEFTKNKTREVLEISKNVRIIFPPVPRATLSLGNASEDQIAEIKTRYHINDETLVILCVCQLVKRKGVDDLIRATAQVKDQNVKLIVIGSGPEKDNLIRLVRELGCQDRIFILGRIENIIPYYRIAKVAALVSYFYEPEMDFEGLGLVLLEAQDFGIPVIGTRSGGIPEAINDGVTGFVVPERDIKAIAEKIEVLKNDRERYEQMHQSTTKWLTEKFDPARNIEDYVNHVKE